MGPSISSRVGEHGAWAFTVGSRTNFSGFDLDRISRRFGVDAIQVGTDTSFRVEEVSSTGSMASWAEAGLTYGRTFNDEGDVRIHLAGTVKYVLGITGASFTFSSPVLTKDSTVTSIDQIELDYAIAVPKGGSPTGQGWNADAGVIFEVMRHDYAEDLRPYWLRIGASVTDLGSVSFNKNARSHRIRNGHTTTQELQDLHLSNLGAIDAALSNLLLGYEGSSLVSRSFKMGLPTALHLSVDICPTHHVAIRLEGVLGMRKPPNALSTRDQLSIVPRYETRMFAASLPISIDRYGAQAIGVCLRYGGVMIGSDRLGGLVGLLDPVGTDVYLGFKLRFKEKAKS